MVLEIEEGWGMGKERKERKGGRREWREERRKNAGRETLISCLCTCPKWGLNM